MTKSAKKISTYLEVFIHPGAKKNQITSFENNILNIRVAAPPVEGKANHQMVGFLSDVLKIAKSSITIKVGLSGKRKVLEITDITSDELKSKLESLVTQCLQK